MRDNIENGTEALCVCAITENVISQKENEKSAQNHKQENEKRLETYFGEFEEETD
ncbi:hypothetical protein [Acetobacter fabarum]|uniref:hypothetical protein n=1 Tax=Acetobacter fabarum TaxID=483199 RepID=UPI0015CC4EF3|nr:hypothetical protein [Acetobacter fabarum]